MNRRNIILWGLIFFFIIVLDIGYSAFGTNLKLSGIVTKVRPQIDIRITNFIYSKSENGGLPSMDEYSKHSLFADFTLPNSNSTVEYIVTITNYGNEEMGILSATLPSELANVLQVEFIDYKIGTKLKNGNDGIVNGNNTTFRIKVGYKSGSYNSNNTTFDNFKLDIAFSRAYDVIYEGFTWSDPTTSPIDSIVRGGTYQQDIGSYNKLRIYQENVEMTNPNNMVSNNILTISNVSGDLKIQNIATVTIKVDTKGGPTLSTKYTVNGTTVLTSSAIESSTTVIIGSKVSVSTTATSSTLNYSSGSYSNNSIQSDVSETITLKATATVNINTNPTGATISYKVNGVAKSDTTAGITGAYDYGTIITITKIEKSGYKTITTEKSYTINSHTTDTITLTPVYQVTINTNPTGATLNYTINSGPEQTTTSPLTGTYEKGTVIKVTASKSGYKTSDTKTYTINSTITDTITLAKLYTYKVASNVSSTIVLEYNNTSKKCTSSTSCSISVVSNTSVKYTISADYYNSSSGTDTVTADYTRNISLAEKIAVSRTFGVYSGSCNSCIFGNAGGDAWDGDWGSNVSSSQLTTESRYFTYTFNGFSDLPSTGKIKSVTAQYAINTTNNVTVSVTMKVGSTECGTASFKHGQLTQKTYYLNCNTNMSTLRSNNITLKIQFNKIFGGYGYWHEADLSVTYIPK